MSEDKWDKWVKLDLFVNKDRWKRWVKQDKRKSNISVMDNMSDFEKLQLYLVDLMVEYGIIATKKFEDAKEKKLSALEIKNVVEGEVDLVKAILSDSDAINLIAQKIKQEYRKR